MSRKDYVAVAALIRRTVDRGGDLMTLHAVVAGLVAIYSLDNPRFDAERFIIACLGESNESEGEGA